MATIAMSAENPIRRNADVDRIRSRLEIGIGHSCLICSRYAIGCARTPILPAMTILAGLVRRLVGIAASKSILLVWWLADSRRGRGATRHEPKGPFPRPEW